MKSNIFAGESSCIHPVTPSNLRRGIHRLFRYHDEKHKPSKGRWEFHNEMYLKLESHRSSELTEAFWNVLVDELWSWKAIRPASKSQVREAGLRYLAELRRCFSQLVRTDEILPSLDSVEWRNVEPLYLVASQIKPTIASKPMFASKLCHFLVPSVYFVTDGKLAKAGLGGYRSYWEACRSAWLNRSPADGLEVILREEMPCQPCDTFPWPTKITELCQFRDVTSK